MSDHCFALKSHEQKKAFERVLGHPIKTDTVRMTHETYVKHAAQIQAVQMQSALKGEH